jgi:SAM-dependent methyltransferase
VGWLCANFAAHGAQVTGVDLTRRGVELTRRRLELLGLSATVLSANAEALPFATASFDFVTAAGVLHHTPDTAAGLREIQRVLRPGGRALISLYYQSWLLSPWLWPLTRFLVRHLFGHLPGRSAFRQVCTSNDLVRLYDGNDNPLGKSYTRRGAEQLAAGFVIEHLEIHYFPRRFVPLGRWLPRWLYRLLDRCCGLMIYLHLRKPD